MKKKISINKKSYNLNKQYLYINKNRCIDYKLYKNNYYSYNISNDSFKW